MALRYGRLGIKNLITTEFCSLHACKMVVKNCLDPPKVYCNKYDTSLLHICDREMWPHDANGLVNCVDPDKTAELSV